MWRCMTYPSPHPSYILSDAFRFGKLALLSATYNLGVFPAMETLLLDLKGPRPAGPHRGAGGRTAPGLPAAGKQMPRDPGLHEKHTRAGAGAHHPLGAGGGHARGAHRPGPAAGGEHKRHVRGRYFLDDTKEANERLLNLLRGLLESGDPLASQVHTGRDLSHAAGPRHRGGRGRRGRARHALGLSARLEAGGVVINSRSEKADFTPMFQRAVRERRCLVPVFRLLRMAAHSLRRKNEGKIRLSIAGQGRQGADVPGGRVWRISGRIPRGRI